MKGLRAPPPLWTCPKCRKQYATPRQFHSCGRWTMAHHFAGRPRARALFRALVAAAREHGRFAVDLQKSRITFMSRMRFVSLVPAKEHLRVSLILGRRVASTRFTAIRTFAPRCHVHSFTLRDDADLDAEMQALLREAAAVGRQERLYAPGGPDA
jgi:hypothetical protein